MSLAAESCVACKGEDTRLTGKEAIDLLKEVADWQMMELERKLFKDFKFKNFAEALQFVTRVAALAEQQNHHPDISFGWGYAEIILTTHAVDGLTRNDFIFAAKIDGLK